MYRWNGRTLGTNYVADYLVRIYLNQIYNADKFGLFYHAQPNKSLNLKNENSVGGKHSKLCLARLIAANAVGEKLPLFVIGKSKKPPYFKDVKHLPCRYRSQKQSWIDSILFEEWVREDDRCFTKEGQKLFCWKNCPAHPSIDNLVSTELIFLSPNTTSTLQRMDQGAMDLTNTEPLMTDDAISCDVLDEESFETEDDTYDVSNGPICPQSSDVRQALDVLREYMLFSDNGEFIYKGLNEISVFVENELSAKLRQADIRSFCQ